MEKAIEKCFEDCESDRDPWEDLETYWKEEPATERCRRVCYKKYLKEIGEYNGRLRETILNTKKGMEKKEIQREMNKMEVNAEMCDITRKRLFKTTREKNKKELPFLLKQLGSCGNSFLNYQVASLIIDGVDKFWSKPETNYIKQKIAHK